MKKVLALVLAFAMVFSSISFAFADTTVAAAKSAEAVACEKLGMVKGDGGEISADYYAKEATRLQAAIMVLRLKGLEQEALAFVGEKNFADMAEYKWAGGKNIAAYLLAHPELGFAGDGKNFMADQKITEQMYYKVMLTALGYKQTTPEVVGDFAYADVIAFAKEKGLAPQGLTTFTNGDIAKVTVEGLKAKNKDGKVLVDALVAAGTLKAEAVKEAGIVAPVVVVEDKVAPKVTKVAATNNNEITVTFDRPIDTVTGADVANYVVKKSTGTALTVKAAKVDGKKAVLTTEGMENLRSYSITVQNVKNASGVVMAAKYAGTFKGVIDNKVPVLDKVNNVNNIRVRLEFNEILDETSAENVANYVIDGLTVQSAKLIEDNDDENTIVELIVSAQKGGSKYTVKVNNVADQYGNAMTKETSKQFYGKASETSAPTLDTANTRALPGNLVMVTFKDTNRLDFVTATDAANYSFNNDLTVESVEVMDADDDDCMAILVKTSEQTKNKSYKLTVKNVADELGNAIKATGLNTSVTGQKEDTVPPYIYSVKAQDEDTIKVVFDNMIETESAEDINNYDLGDLGKPFKAELDKSDRKTVELTTSTQVSRKKYELKITGVKDIQGNVATEATSHFVGYSTEADTAAPSVDYVEVVSDSEVRLHLNKPVIVTANNNVATFTELSNGTLTATTVTADFVGGTWYYGDPYGGYHDDGSVIELKLDSALNANKSYRLTAVASVKDFSNNAFSQDFTDSDNYFEVSGTTNKNERPTVVSIEEKFAKRIEVTFSEKVVPDSSITGGVTIDGVSFSSVSQSVAGATKVRFNTSTALKDNKTINFNFSSLVKDLQGDWAADEEDELGNDGYTFNDANKKTEFVTYLDDEDGPEVLDVVAVNNKQIKVTYNERLASNTTGTYKLTYKNDNGNTVTVSGWAVDTFNSDYASGDIRLRCTGSNELEGKYTYKLEIDLAYDANGNKMANKADFEFVGTDVTPNYGGVTNVQVINGKTLYAIFGDYFTKEAQVGNSIVVTEIYEDSNGNDVRTTLTTIGTGNIADREDVGEVEMDDYTLELTTTGAYDVFYAGGTFELALNNNAVFKFESVMEDAGLYINNSNQVVYGDIKAGDQVSVYDWATRTVIEANVTAAKDTPVSIDWNKDTVKNASDVAAAGYYIIHVKRAGNIIYAARVEVK